MIPDMCDPDNRHRHVCPMCMKVEECDERDCRFNTKDDPPASPVTCSGKCFFAQIDKFNADNPTEPVDCVSCGVRVGWNVEGRCYLCDKHDVPARPKP